MWTSACDNLDALRRHFGSMEGLDRIELHEIVLHRDGPRLLLRFDLPRYADRPAPRWPAEANAVQVELRLSGVSGLRLEGWDTGNAGRLTVSVEGAVRRIAFDGEGGGSIRASFDFARIERISGYLSDPDGG